MRDYMGGKPIGLYAYFHGQLAKVMPSPFHKGEIMHTRYQVRGLMRYALFIDDNEVPIYNWDFFTNEFQTGKLVG